MSNLIKEQEPLWRDEFSISKADERYVNRRQLDSIFHVGKPRDVRGESMDSCPKLVTKGSRLFAQPSRERQARCPLAL